jgi:hypothetical protein
MKAKKNKELHTTVGELAAAFYEAALAELKDEAAAALVARQMVLQHVRRRAFA